MSLAPETCLTCEMMLSALLPCCLFIIIIIILILTYLFGCVSFSCSISLLCQAGSFVVVHRLSSCGAQASLRLSMWDPSSATRDLACIPCLARQILNHWTTKEVPTLYSFQLTSGHQQSLGKATAVHPVAPSSLCSPGHGLAQKDPLAGSRELLGRAGSATPSRIALHILRPGSAHW